MLIRELRLQVTHNIFHKSQEGSSSPMSTDSSPTSQGDTMSTSCGSNQTSTLAASLQQSSATQSMSSDDTPSTKLGSLQVLPQKLLALLKADALSNAVQETSCGMHSDLRMRSLGANGSKRSCL